MSAMRRAPTSRAAFVATAREGTVSSVLGWETVNAGRTSDGRVTPDYDTAVRSPASQIGRLSATNRITH